MRALIVSDIHANLAAFEAVLKDARAVGAIDAVWNMGDSVGYGPQPSECIALLREHDASWVAGNHERAATGAMGIEDFNQVAGAAALWTKSALSPGEKDFLDGLPETRAEGDWVLVHGTLREPIWEYLLDEDSALAHFSLMTVPFSFVGHTHVPAVVRQAPKSPRGCEMQRLRDGDVVRLSRDTKTVLNPGSVGQPRDGDPRSSYGIYDSEVATFTLHRVDYDIEATQRLMMEAELPDWLSERLAIGR